RLDVQLAGVEQGLGGDAADVEAGAAQRGTLLDDSGLQAQLGGADGGDVAARPRPDHDDVVQVGHVGSPRWGRQMMYWSGPGDVSALWRIAAPRSGALRCLRPRARRKR